MSNVIQLRPCDQRNAEREQLRADAIKRAAADERRVTSRLRRFASGIARLPGELIYIARLVLGR